MELLLKMPTLEDRTAVKLDIFNVIFKVLNLKHKSTSTRLS